LSTSLWNVILVMVFTVFSSLLTFVMYTGLLEVLGSNLQNIRAVFVAVSRHVSNDVCPAVKLAVVDLTTIWRALGNGECRFLSLCPH